MTTKKTQPLNVHPHRPNCPVCGTVSYSSSGVHPQCAMQKADAERMKRVKTRAKAPKKAASKGDISPWQKLCPKCRAIVHIRKKVCACGCALGGTSRS